MPTSLWCCLISADDILISDSCDILRAILRPSRIPAKRAVTRLQQPGNHDLCAFSLQARVDKRWSLSSLGFLNATYLESQVHHSLINDCPDIYAYENYRSLKRLKVLVQISAAMGRKRKLPSEDTVLNAGGGWRQQAASSSAPQHLDSCTAQRLVLKCLWGFISATELEKSAADACADVKA